MVPTSLYRRYPFGGGTVRIAYWEHQAGKSSWRFNMSYGYHHVDCSAFSHAAESSLRAIRTVFDAPQSRHSETVQRKEQTRTRSSWGRESILKKVATMTIFSVIKDATLQTVTQLYKHCNNFFRERLSGDSHSQLDLTWLHRIWVSYQSSGLMYTAHKYRLTQFWRCYKAPLMRIKLDVGPLCPKLCAPFIVCLTKSQSHTSTHYHILWSFPLHSPPSGRPGRTGRFALNLVYAFFDIFLSSL